MQSGVPLEDALLISHNPRVSVSTNSCGRADLSAFEQADSIQIRMLGFETLTVAYDKIQKSDYCIGLKPISLSLDQVVVSAVRWRQTSGNVPLNSVSVLPGDVFLQNPQTSADLLGGTGKIFIQKSQQGGGSPMIRGFATNRLMYSVDGVRMNNAIFRGGNLQNVINIDPFVIRKAEVLMGPGSVQYGSDAIGGVMTFQTLKPQLSESNQPLVKGKTFTRYSSANKEKTGHFDVNIGLGKIALLTSYSRWDYGHLKQGSKGPEDYIKAYYVERQGNQDVHISQGDHLLQIPTAYSQFNLMQKVRVKAHDSWDIRYGFHLSETSSYGRYDRHNRLSDGYARYARWDYGPQKWMMNNLVILHQKRTPAFDQFKFTLAQQSFEESRISRNLNEKMRNKTEENVTAYSANIDFIKSLDENNSLFYGLEYVFNRVHSNGTTEFLFNNFSLTDSVADAPARYPQATWSSIAAYVSDEFKVSERLTLQAGLRYNIIRLDADFNDNLVFYPFPFSVAEIKNGALTGSFGSVFRPSENWVLKANFGTAFRAPNVDDVGKVFDSEPGSVVVPNPDLKPEYAYSIDLAITKVFGDLLKMDLAGYYTVLQNALVRRDFQLNGKDSIIYDGSLSHVQAIQNASVANIYGIQAGLEIKFPKGLYFLSDFNCQIGKEELDNGQRSSSRHAPPFFGTSRLRCRLNKLLLDFNVRYQGRKKHNNLPLSEQGKDEIYALDRNGKTYAPAWHTLNLKAVYHFTKMISFSTGIENISDQRYRPYSSGISGAGRNFIMSMRVKI